MPPTYRINPPAVNVVSVDPETLAGLRARLDRRIASDAAREYLDAWIDSGPEILAGFDRDWLYRIARKLYP